MNNRLFELGLLQRRGVRAGVFSICSSSAVVLETAMETAASIDTGLVIESTCNQVNQYGGYSGMTPDAFVSYVADLAGKTGFLKDRLLVGGDHLGPYPWKNENAQSAMEKAGNLVNACVSAGYGKIHLDCGMPLADDKHEKIPPELSAKRTAYLCGAAEAAKSDKQRKEGLPLYVIGAEAPTPGGSLFDDEDVVVTGPGEISGFLETCKKQFYSQGLEDAWERVAAIVVQPGIDFGPGGFVSYNSRRAAELSAFHDQLPGRMTYEVHATDFQRPQELSEMVDDHFALLKTGPVLTFAMREAVFALSAIENELVQGRKSLVASDIINVIDRKMTASEGHWRSHVGGDEDVRILRLYGFTDRVRYYWNYPAVREAWQRLLQNLDRPIPLVLISQYFPEAFNDVFEKKLPAQPFFLVRNRVLKALAPYFEACRNAR